MASQTIKLNPADVLLIAGDSRIRELTEYGSETRQRRDGSNLIGFTATALSAGGALGVVQVSTAERDLTLSDGIVLTVSGITEATFAGTAADYGLRATVYAQHVEPTTVNAWPLLAEAVRRSAQAAAK